MPITELRIEGLRTIEKVRLELDGLTVLIGDNGTGKSSILEACEILRRATERRFMDELYGIHGGLNALLRQGANRLTLGVTVRPVDGEREPADSARMLERDFESVEYDLTISPDITFATIEETIRVKPKATNGGPKPRATKRKSSTRDKAQRDDTSIVRLSRRASRFQISPSAAYHGESSLVESNIPFLATLWPESGEIDPGYFEAQLVSDYLSAMLVNLPFETTPAWAARALDRKSALRASALLTPANHLEKLGLNLASSFHALKNNFDRAHWEQTLSYIRLGLGERIDDVVTWVDPGGGNIGLSLKLVGLDRAIPSAQLSDGMLSYLAFVALFRLHTTKPSLLTFDEPDLHLHPHLLARVLDMFESMARDCPVLLATHSDRLLDGLTDPAKSVVLCELDERGATRLVRPDHEALAKWLERYRGLGDIRGAGHAASVLTKVEPG